MTARKSKSKRPATSITIPKYQNRVTLFVDFLGFKELVDRTRQKPAELRNLVAALNEIRNRNVRSDVKLVTQFSDSLVISYPDMFGTRSLVLADIGWTILFLVRKGFLLRGAITAGDLYHTDRHVVGPAMVRAYEMESKRAKYPRVIIDSDVATYDHANGQKYMRVFASMDTDDEFFVDYISWRSFMEFAGSAYKFYPAHLGAIAKLLKNGLKHGDRRVVEKYLWLWERYSAAIAKFGTEPRAFEFHADLEDNIRDELMALPPMADLASEARKRIAESSV